MGKYPDKKFGQNFLTDDSIITKICDIADLKESDEVVEIGPGIGAITRELAKRAKRVIAIELDRDLAEYLRKNVPKNVTVVTGDALDVDWTVEIESGYKIVANIPFSITSPLMRKIINLEKRPNMVVLLTQKEVAERLSALPDSSERGMLTVLVEAVFNARKTLTIKPGSFYPPPEVDSAVLVLEPKEKDLRETIYWPIVEAGFRQKRQMLINSISKNMPIPKTKVTDALKKLGLDEGIRAEDLSLENWQKLSDLIK